MQTPIKSPMGKTRALSFIEELVPKGKIVSSCNFFSGEVEFYLSNRDRFFNCKTTKEVVIDFWNCMFENPVAISECASMLFPLKYEKEIGIMQENWSSFKSPHARAAVFYVFNNCTEDGWVSRGALNMDALNPVLFSRLRRFKKPENIELTKSKTIEDLLSQHETSDILFLRIPKIKKNFLSDGLAVGIEEQKIDFHNIYEDLKTKSYIILTKPSKFVSNIDCDLIYIDKYGRKTTEQNAKEVILHNV